MANAQGIRAGRAFVEIGADDTALARGLARVQGRLRAMGASITAVGASFAKVGGLAALPFVGSAKAFLDFESAMARVKAITQASPADFKRLSDKAEELGRVTAFSSTEAANALGFFAEAGLTVDQMLTAIGPALDLAATGNLGVAEAADISAKAMRGMGLQAADLTHLVDVLAKAFISGGGRVEGLGDALRFVGPIARTAGISLEEIVAAIQLLTKAGIGGEMAGTTLRGMILSLTSPSKEAADELAKLGVQVKDERGNFRSLTDIIGQLEKALAGAGSASKLEKLGTIFPARAAAGVAALVSEGAGPLAAATKALAGSTGTAARVAGVQLDTLRGAVKVLTSSVEVLGTAVGSAVNPALREFGAVLTGAVNGLALWAKANKDVVAAIAEGVAAVAGFGVALVVAGQAAKVLALGLDLVRAAAVATTAVVLALNTAVNLTRIAGALTALLTPSGLLTAAFVAGGVALAKWAVESGTASDALSTLGGAVATLQTDAVAAFGGMAAALKGGDIALAARILWATLNLEWVRGTTFLSKTWHDWTDGTVAVITRTVTAIRELWSELIGFLGNTWERFVAEALSGPIGSVVDVFRAAFKEIGEFVAFAFSGDPVYKLASAIIDVVAAAKTSFAAMRGYGEKELAKIEADRLEAQKALVDQEQAGKDERAKAAEDRAAKAKADLKAAQDELAKALALAKTGPLSGQFNAGGKQADDLKAFADQEAGLNRAGRQRVGLLGAVRGAAGAVAGTAGGAAEQPPLTPEGLDQTIEMAQRKVEVKGSFSALAAAGLGAGDTTADALKDEIKEGKKEQQKTTKELEKLNDKARQGKLVFQA